jgi:hypothetical protein
MAARLIHETLNAGYPHGHASRHFRIQQPALRTLYLVALVPGPRGTSQTR